jgi:CHRD domain
VGEFLGTYFFIFSTCLENISHDQQQCCTKGDASMHRRIVKLALLGVMGVLLITGYTVASPSAFAQQGSTKAHAVLRHTPHGFASLHWEKRTENLRVTISLVGLAANSTHPAHIHLGDCDDNGPIVYPLNNVVADAAGDATVTTVIPEVEGGIPASSWYVNVHNGPGLGTPDQFDPIACGNVVNPNASSTEDQSVRIFLGGTTAPNQSAFGFAQLIISGDDLLVEVNVHNLVPGSVHAAHIHAGSCESQLPGNIVYPLNNVVADANGNAESETVIEGVSSIPENAWYVNVHRSTDLSTQTGFDPIACGNVEN